MCENSTIIERLDEFNNRAFEFQRNYNGDFNVDSNFFTTRSDWNNGTVTLEFNNDLEIPDDVRAEISDLFNEIFN